MMEDIVTLMTDETTCHLEARQVEEIERFVIGRQQEKRGIAIAELPTLETIIVLCAEKIHRQVDGFENALILLLQVCEKPFEQANPSEKYTNKHLIESSLVTFSSLLQSSSNLVKIGAANVLFEFTKSQKLHKAVAGNEKANNGKTEEIPRIREQNKLHDQRPDEWTYNQHLFQKSGAMSLVATAVRNEVEYLFRNDIDGDGRISAAEYDLAYGIRPGDENAKPQVCTVPLMKLVGELAAYRENALSLNRENVPQLLVQVVAQLEDFRKQEIKLMVHILWSVLEHSVERISCSQVSSNRMQLLDKYRHANALYGLGNIETLGMLRSLLERMLVEGFKSSDKELRNEVLIISSLLAKRDKNLAYFNETGFLSLLVLYATAAESDLPTGCDERHFATCSQLDMEMKFLSWYLVKELCSHPDNLQVVGDSLFLSGLLFYLDPKSKSLTCRTKWSTQQICSIQLNAAMVLGYMIPLFPEHFVSLGGPSTLVDFLSTSFPPEMFTDPDQQQQRQQIEMDHEIIGSTLKALINGCGIDGGVESLIRTQKGEELISLLVGYFNVPNAEIRCSASLLVSLITKNQPELQRSFRRRKGINILCSQFLVLDSRNFLYSDNILVAALACVHHAIVGCQKSELRFLAVDGIDRLLTILEQASAIQHKAQVLATLSDLIKSNEHVRPYVLQWRSGASGATAVELSLDVWLTVFSPNTIQDFERPLQRYAFKESGLDSDTRIEESCTASATGGSESSSPPKKGRLARLQEALQAAKTISIPDDLQRVLDGANMIDIRDRIFSFLVSIGFENIDKTGLSRDQRVVYALAESYVLFVRGEEWTTIQNEISSMGLKPVYYDQAYISARIQDTVDQAKATSEIQENEIQAKVTDGVNEDEAFFNSIREKIAQQEQARLVKKQVSVMKRRLEQKEKQKQMLQRASMIQQPQ